MTKEKLSELEALCENTPKQGLGGWSKITTIQIRPEVVLDLIAEVKRQRDVIEKLRAALEKLANEAQGFQSLANVADHGHTNMECLALRIREAREALKEIGE